MTKMVEKKISEDEKKRREQVKNLTDDDIKRIHSMGGCVGRMLIPKRKRTKRACK